MYGSSRHVIEIEIMLNSMLFLFLSFASIEGID